MFEFRDGALYRGQFKQGKPEGHGEQRKADGTCYRGMFKDGTRPGRSGLFGFRGEWGINFF